MNNLILENIPRIGKLECRHTLFSFENIPIVFLATDKNEDIYFCLYNNMPDLESWLIDKPQPETLNKVINNKISVFDVFASSSEKLLLVDKINETTSYSFKYFKDMDDSELPDKYEKLDLNSNKRTKAYDFIESISKHQSFIVDEIVYTSQLICKTIEHVDDYIYNLDKQEEVYEGCYINQINWYPAA